MAYSLETQVDDYLYYTKLKDIPASKRLLEVKFINPDDIIDELGWEHDQYHFDAVINGIRKFMHFIWHSDDPKYDTYRGVHIKKLHHYKNMTSQDIICDYLNNGICELPAVYKKGDRFYPGDLSWSISWDDTVSDNYHRIWRKEETDAVFTVVSEPYWAIVHTVGEAKASKMFVDCVSNKTNKTYRFCAMHNLDKSVLDSDYEADAMDTYYPTDDCFVYNDDYYID